MKEAITFSCGHVKEVTLPSDIKVRNAMRKHMVQQKCSTCTYQEKCQMALQRAEELGLIPLQGSPKQIIYGNLVRVQQVDLFLKQIDFVKREQWSQLFQQLLSIVNEQTDAVWWIEHQELRHIHTLLGKSWKHYTEEEL